MQQKASTSPSPHVYACAHSSLRWSIQPEIPMKGGPAMQPCSQSCDPSSICALSRTISHRQGTTGPRQGQKREPLPLPTPAALRSSLTQDSAQTEEKRPPLALMHWIALFVIFFIASTASAVETLLSFDPNLCFARDSFASFQVVSRLITMEKASIWVALLGHGVNARGSLLSRRPVAGIQMGS